MRRYDPEPYQPDGGCSLLRLPLFFAILLGAAVVLGAIAGFVKQWIYLVLLFPLFIGAGVMAAGAVGIRLAHLRSRILAGAGGLLAAFLCVLTIHYVGYLLFLNELKKVPVINVPGAPIGANVQVKVPKIDFFTYLHLRAKQGVRFGKIGQEGTNLGYVGTWIYWGVDFLCLAVFPVFVLPTWAGAPYCRACGEWMSTTPLGSWTGRADAADLLREGELDKLMEVAPGAQPQQFVLTCSACPNCREQSLVVIKLDRQLSNPKGETKTQTVAHLRYPGEALSEFEALFRAPPSPTA